MQADPAVATRLRAGYRLRRLDVPALPASRLADVAVGAIGGLAGGFAGLPGMLLVIWCGLRGLPQAAQRALYQPFILLMQLEALACLQLQLPAALSAELFALYMPLSLAAAAAGLAVFRRLSARHFSIAVNALLLVCGVALLGGALAVDAHSKPVGGNQGLSASAHPERAQDRADVDLGGVFGDIEFARDELVGKPFEQQPEHFALAG